MYKRTIFGWLSGIALFCLSASVYAGQSAKMTCTKHEPMNGYFGDAAIICVEYELRVTITTDGDQGRVGALGIGVQLEDGRLAYWTMNGGFGAYFGGLVQPTEGVMSSLPTKREYLVFRGVPEQLCEMAERQSFKMYAGHGSVPPEKEALLERLLNFKFRTPYPIDHIKGAFIQHDVIENPWKIGEVYSWNKNWCNGGNEENITGAPIQY